MDDSHSTKSSVPNCLICFDQNTLKNIYHPNHKHLLDFIQHLLGYELYIEGGLFNICLSCEGKLVWCDEFKSLCVKSLGQFRTIHCKNVGVDYDNSPQVGECNKSDSDDAPLSRPKRRKKVLSRACKGKSETDTLSSTAAVAKQYSSERVLNAIAENNSDAEDVEFRSCVHCNYVAALSSELTYHMQSTHKESFKNWCNLCNIQTTDLLNHTYLKKCLEIRCKFCDKPYLNRNLLNEHLQTHCYNIFNPSLDNIDNNTEFFSACANLINTDNQDENGTDVENIFSNSEEDSDYIPQLDPKNLKKSPKGRRKKNPPTKISKTDNLMKASLSKIRRKIYNTSAILKPNISNEYIDNKSAQAIDNEINKPNSSKQFLEEDVLKAITDSTRYFTDVKNKTCVHCKWEAGNAKILSVHMKRKHAKLVNNWCYQCNEQTNNLNLHVRKTKCNKFHCKFCNKIFLRSCRLANHLKTHSHKSFIEYKDLSDVRRLKQFPASDIFKAISEYEAYMTELKNRKCILCDFEAPISSTLRLHMTLKHDDVFEKWCKHCNLQTDSLSKHLTDVKCHERSCKFCRKICNDKYFIQHVRTHCKNYAFYKHDPDLGSTLQNKTLLKARTQFPPDEVLKAISEKINSNTDAKFMSCIICDFQGHKRKSLTLHMRFGHKEVFDNWCSRCNIQTENLQNHYDTVKCGEELCVLCNKVFLSIKTLIRHIKSHCRKIFKHSGNDEYDFDWVCNQSGGQLDENSDLSDSGPNTNVAKSNINTSNSLLKNTQVETRQNSLEDRIGEEESVGCHDNNSDNELNANVFTKDARFGPLKQFPKDAVYNAIMDCLKSFYTNRKCIVCNYLTLNSRCLGTHMSCHKEIKDKWCTLCNAVVGDVAKHWETHKNDLLKCTFCSRPFENPETLRDHLKRHCRSFTFDPKQKWFVCRYCPNSYPQEQLLKEHKCDGYDPKKINGAAFCTICKKRVHNLRFHMKQKHNPEGHKSKVKGKKERHRKLCPICGKTFLVSYLEAHMYSHSGEMPYKCSYCDKGFPLTSILRAHMKRHSDDKPFVCHICGKGFVTNCEHRSHMQIHEGSPVQCTVCNKEFPRPAVLALHMKRHTGENPFSCFHCGISYHRKSLLLNHMRTHSDTRPFKCSFCDKYFRDPKTLQQHENIHKGIKPYACSICSFSCTQSHALTCHMKQHPEDTPQADRPYKCLHCYRSFSTNAMLMSHTNLKHRENTT